MSNALSRLSSFSSYKAKARCDDDGMNEDVSDSDGMKDSWLLVLVLVGHRLANQTAEDFSLEYSKVMLMEDGVDESVSYRLLEGWLLILGSSLGLSDG